MVYSFFTKRHQYSLILIVGVTFVLSVALSGELVRAYNYPGFKWNTTSVGYYLNIAGWSHLPIHYAKDAWNNAGSPFRFTYLGMTADPVRKDWHNIVTRANRGSTRPLGETTDYCNTPYPHKCSAGRTIIESDVVYNDYYPWGAYGEPNLYDLESAAVHEFGHWLSLDHVTSGCSSGGRPSMCDGMGVGQFERRTLESDDRNGINAIY